MVASAAFMRRLISVHEPRDDVDGHGEDDRAVLLRRDAVQRLKVAQLRKKTQ